MDCSKSLARAVPKQLPPPCVAHCRSCCLPFSPPPVLREKKKKKCTAAHNLHLAAVIHSPFPLTPLSKRVSLPHWWKQTFTPGWFSFCSSETWRHVEVRLCLVKWKLPRVVIVVPHLTHCYLEWRLSVACGWTANVLGVEESRSISEMCFTAIFQRLILKICTVFHKPNIERWRAVQWNSGITRIELWWSIASGN